MRTRSFNYEFEELPLIVSGGFEAGLLNGSAEINYFATDDWSVGTVSLDGHRRRVWTAEEMEARHLAGLPCPMFERNSVPLRPASDLAGAIKHRLEHEWRQAVQDALNEHIAEERECAAGDEADRRHDERKLGAM